LDIKKKDDKPAKTPLAKKILRSSLLNIAALAVVIAIPSIEHITEITGATFVTIVCYLIPCALFLTISGKGTKGDILHRPMPDIGAIPGSVSMHRFLVRFLRKPPSPPPPPPLPPRWGIPEPPRQHPLL
jgi:hypothetical protein